MNKKRYGILLAAGLSITLTGCSLTGINSSSSSSSNSSLTPEEMEYIAAVYEFLKENYYTDVDMRTLLDGMIYGLTDAFGDPYTYYTSAANNEYQDYSSSGVGLGFARTLYYGEAYVDQVMKNSPAEKGGLKEKDVIFKVRNINEDSTYQDFYYLKDHHYDDWGNVLLGDEGSKIEVYVKRLNNAGVYEEVSEPLIVTRGVYNVDKARLLEFTNTDAYTEAYVEISSFLGDPAANETTPQDELKKIFDEEIFVDGVSKLDHLIIDLRGNSGGYVSNCVDTLGLFIPKDKPTGYYRYADGSYAVLKNTNIDTQYTSKIDDITLIIDSNTASAGEAFAIGLRDSTYTDDKITIVGQVSYGKGIAQTFQSLFDDGSLIRFTFAEVLSPTKKSINKRGIVPDRFIGPEYVPYEEYVKYIAGVADNNELSEENRQIILNRINILLGGSFTSFEEAVSTCKKILKVNDSEERMGLYNEKIAKKLQDKFYDNVILYYGSSVYTGHVEALENNDYLSSAQRIFIKEKINFYFSYLDENHETYDTFDKAVKAFQEEFDIVNEDGIYDKTTADLLQGKVMDIHLDIYDNKVIEEVRSLYGSKKV